MLSHLDAIAGTARTVEELATNRYILLAQVITHLAKYEMSRPKAKAA